MQADVTTLDAKKAGTVELADECSGSSRAPDILQRMVRYQLAKREAARAQVQGSLRGQLHDEQAVPARRDGPGPSRQPPAPICSAAAASAFGPEPRSHAIDLPKKVRALALRHALSAKAKSETLVVIDKCELRRRQDQGAQIALR